MTATTVPATFLPALRVPTGVMCEVDLWCDKTKKGLGVKYQIQNYHLDPSASTCMDVNLVISADDIEFGSFDNSVSGYGITPHNVPEGQVAVAPFGMSSDVQVQVDFSMLIIEMMMIWREMVELVST